MSTSSAVYGVAPAMPPERRFYRRIAPTKLLYVSFGTDNLGMLVNVSESGLMVSTPERLALNSVFRVELHLNGLANTIKVHVRTVWTEGSQKRSGIQLLDLSENDREQIRKWGRQQIVRNEEPAEVASPETMVLSELAETSFETKEPQPGFAECASAQEGSGFVVATPSVPAMPASLSLASLDMDHFGNDVVPAGQNVLASRTKAASSKVVLIVWSASMAAICMATGWSYRHELGDRLSRHSAHSARAVPSAGQSAPVAASDPASNAPAASGSSPRETTAAADEEKFRVNVGTEELDAPAAKPNLSAPAKQHREESRGVGERPELSDSEVADTGSDVSPTKDTVGATPAPSTGGIRPSARISAPVPVETRPSANISAAAPEVETHTSASTFTPAHVLARPSASAPVPAPVEPQAGANSSAQTALETRPFVNAAPQVPMQTWPAANTAVPLTSTPKVLSVDASPTRSAITGSISPTNSDRSRSSTPSNGVPFATSPATSPSTNSSANASLSAHSAASHVDRSSAVIQMDVPAARVVELTSTSHTKSFVLLPGEQILKSNAMTIHVRRLVRVPGDHWLLWRGRKKVVVGGLTSRVDPQIPHAPTSYGTITVQATIAEDGQVISLTSVNGNLAFLSNVSAAVNEWRYEPTYVDNRQVETQAQIEVDFHPVATLRASKR